MEKDQNREKRPGKCESCGLKRVAVKTRRRILLLRLRKCK